MELIYCRLYARKRERVTSLRAVLYIDTTTTSTDRIDCDGLRFDTPGTTMDGYMFGIRASTQPL